MTKQLTEAQARVVHQKSGKFVVWACPGSGKTFTIAARLFRLLSSWDRPNQGIAALSFTNVAWEQIERHLAQELGVSIPLAHPHFLGTIDSFLNRYIFLPFGHLLMDCQGRPELMGPPLDDRDPIGSWMWWGQRECNQKLCRLNEFTYDDKDDLTSFKPSSHFSNCESGHKRCAYLKQQLHSKYGKATQLDANYFAMKLLSTFPCLAQALAIRFPMIVVDEAQDSSIVQMKALDLLAEAGLAEVMLVGDPDQAIYEWRTAQPRLFMDKWELWRENSETFNGNWRSSQAICDFAQRIASLEQPMQSLAEEGVNIECPPEIWPYENENELPDLVGRFVQKCQNRDIPKDGMITLGRSNEFLRAIGSGSASSTGLMPWSGNDSTMHGIARAKYLLDIGDTRDAFRGMERTVCLFLNKARVFTRGLLDDTIDRVGWSHWRGCLYELLSSLPSSDQILPKWVREANHVLRQSSLLPDLLLGIKSDSTKHTYSTLRLSDVFGAPADVAQGMGCPIGTVHSVKGMTLDAVLLVLKKKAGRSSLYPRLLDKNITEAEELRVLYVAITRPRKVLVLAVPHEHAGDWHRRFLENPDT